MLRRSRYGHVERSRPRELFFPKNPPKPSNPPKASFYRYLQRADSWRGRVGRVGRLGGLFFEITSRHDDSQLVISAVRSRFPWAAVQKSPRAARATRAES